MVSKSKRRRLAKERNAQAAQPKQPPQPKKKTGSSKKNKRSAATRNMSSSFAACVLNPFSSVGMVSGVPDRYDGLSVGIENVTISKCTGWVKNGTMYVMVLPAFGMNLYSFGLKADKTPDVGTFDSVNANIGPGEGKKFSQFRTVSLAVKVTYVGKALDASGSIMASQFPLRLTQDQKVLYSLNAQSHLDSRTVEPSLTEAQTLLCAIKRQLAEVDKTLGIASGSSSTAKGLLNTVNRIVDDTVSLAGSSKDSSVSDVSESNLRILEPPTVTPTVLLSQLDSVMVPAARGITCVGKHNTGDSWNFTSLDVSPYYLTFLDIQPTQDGQLPRVYGNQVISHTTLQGVDLNVNGILLAFENIPNDQFVIEVRHCIEAVPDISVGLYRSLARPSPPLDRNALDRVTDAQRKLPTGSAGDSVNWGSLVSKAISGIDIRKILSGIGHMTIGPAMSIVDQFF